MGQKLRTALEERCVPAIRFESLWDARLAEGQPVVRLLLGDQWWEVRLKHGAWRSGQSAAYEKIASGKAYGELFFFAPRTGAAQRSDGDPAHGEIKCRVVAWLPREQMEGPLRDALPVQANQFDAGEYDEQTMPVGEMDIRHLRDAIRANRVSFPSQIPALTKHDRPDLQRKLAQLYFVLGWDCDSIGQRYGLSHVRVRQLLNTWKCRAAHAGYIQYIPSVEAISQQLMVTLPPHPIAEPASGLATRFVPAPYPSAPGFFPYPNHEHSIPAR
jgi:hypothetical protein